MIIPLVVNIDILLLLFKRVLEERPEFRILIVSATVDTSIFETYYPQPKFSYKLFCSV